MASIFGFRTRHPGRNRQTDVARFGRLIKLFDQICAEIDAEKRGLENRYQSASMNAAFLVEALENDTAPSRLSSRVGQLTNSILNHERRIAALSRQIGMVNDLRHSLHTVVGDNQPEASKAIGEGMSAAAGDER